MSLTLFHKTRPFDELSYASVHDSKPRQILIRTIEALSGRAYFAACYDRWRSESYGKSATMMADMLQAVGIDLRIEGAAWPPAHLPSTPLVLVANHPFGIGDGIAILKMAESLDRPFRVLINNELLKVPEIREFSLPVNFDETRDALEMNMRTRKEAESLLKQGVTIVVFPAGGVATAPKGFGKAQDLPWKMFPAKMILSAGASVIPIYFEGQNSWLFHAVSRFSLMLRLSLFIREFRKLVGKTITARVGPLIPAQTLAAMPDRKALTAYLYDAVFSLGRKP